MEKSGQKGGIYHFITNIDRKFLYFGYKYKDARLFSSGKTNHLIYFRRKLNYIIDHESPFKFWYYILYFQVQALSGRLTDMGVTEILPRKTYNIRVTIPFDS